MATATRSGNRPHHVPDGVILSDTMDEPNDSVYSSDDEAVYGDLWDGHSTVSVSSASSGEDDSSEDGNDGNNVGDGNNNGKPPDKWVVKNRKTKLYKRIAFRDFPPLKKEDAGNYLQSEYELREFKKFTRDKLELSKDCTKKVYTIVKNFSKGEGYKNTAWDMPFLAGKEIKTLDYDFDELADVARLAQDTLGDSRKGYLALALNHLRRYQHYVYLKNTLTPVEFRKITKWRKLLMSH